MNAVKDLIILTTQRVRLSHLLIFAIFSTFLILTGCATFSDVVRNKGSGVVKVYPVGKKDAYEISRKVLRWEDCNEIFERNDQNLLLTSSSMRAFTMGTLMGAWLEPLDSSHTRVTIVTKRRMSTNVFTTLSEETFHERFAQAVDILMSGKPLPELAP